MADTQLSKLLSCDPTSLPADRETDCLLAEFVYNMHIELRDVPGYPVPVWLFSRDPDSFIEYRYDKHSCNMVISTRGGEIPCLPQWSDGEGLEELINHVAERYGGLVLYTPPNTRAPAVTDFSVDAAAGFPVYAPTAALAVCRAALKMEQRRHKRLLRKAAAEAKQP